MLINQSSKRLLSLATIALLLATGCSAAQPQPKPRDQAVTEGKVELHHVHGLGYSADGSQLFVPAHDGFRVYTNGRWQVPDLPRHDYMGYQAVDNGFYSSGHPGPGSDLPEPLGLVKSTDGGKTLAKLGFQGETDFHTMGVGYRNHAIYVMNPQANSKLQAGVYYSLDDGQTWKQSALKGMASPPIQLAVHPTKANVVALAAPDGLFLSTDHGNTFARIGEAGPVTAAAFSPDGETIYFGFTRMLATDLAGRQVRSLQSPVVKEKDAIGYIAVNPAKPEELAFGTFGKDIHLSSDSGKTWRAIALQGKAQ